MAKARKARSLAEQIAQLDDPKPKDFDPEAINDPVSSDDDDGSDAGSEDQFTGREHYVDVGKSKLRKRDIAPLGPQYAGAKVSRSAIEEEDSDDPFAKGSGGESNDEEEESDGGSDAGSDEEEDEISADEDGVALNGEDESGSEDFDEDEDGDDGSEGEESEEEEEGGVNLNGESNDIDRAKLRKMMKEESKTVAATISVAAKADAEKGKAVKAQRKTFDSILNARIRLQKALIASNAMAVPAEANGTDKADADADTAAVEAAFKSAETAALNLLNNVTRLRAALDSARTGSKRSAAVAFSEETSSEQIWSVLRTSEAASKQYRNSILEKWSAKSRPTQVAAPSRRINSAAGQQSLTSVLQSHLSDSARLVAKTQMPRSCAPKQTSASPAIYDDADFYGLLLKELLEQRSAELGSSVSLPALDGVSAQYRAAREAKTKKVVDTRASKGRKLRYVVHEKLQNYMAPEDRGTWGERQMDELFGSLLGRRLALEEEEEADEEMEDAEDAGLKLFRS